MCKYFPSKANLLKECHSDCSCLSKKRRKERKAKKKIKCTYIKYAYNIFFKFFKIPKEKLKLQEQSDSWKMKHSSITLCQSNGPYTGKGKSYQTILFLFEISSRSTSSCSSYCYAIFSYQGNGMGQNIPRPVALKNRGRKAEQWKRLHLTTHTLTSVFNTWFS